MRARAVVGEPFFEPGPPLTLGRVGSIDAGAGRPRRGRGDRPRSRHRRRAARPRHRRLRRRARAGRSRPGVAAPWPDGRRGRGRPGCRPTRAPPTAAPICATCPRSRSILPTPAITTTPSRSTASACSCTSPTWPRSCPRAGRSTVRPPGGRRRCTCPGRVDPMLPARLSSDLCSLLPGRDRFALTVEIGARPAARLLAASSAATDSLTYDEAEAMLASGEGPPELVAALRAARPDRPRAGRRPARARRRRGRRQPSGRSGSRAGRSSRAPPAAPARPTCWSRS